MCANSLEQDRKCRRWPEAAGHDSTAPFILFDRAGTGPLMAVHVVGAEFTTYLYSWSADLSTVESSLILSTSGSYTSPMRGPRCWPTACWSVWHLVSHLLVPRSSCSARSQSRKIRVVPVFQRPLLRPAQRYSALHPGCGGGQYRYFGWVGGVAREVRASTAHPQEGDATSPSISRASCAVATSRPACRAQAANCAISGPFEVALLPSGR